MSDIALVTSNDPRYRDPEIDAVAAAFETAGVSTDVVSWDDELDWASYPLVVVRSPWDYFDRVAQFCDWAAQVQLATRLVNPADVIRWNSHKGYLLDMASRGVPTVPTVLIPGESVDAADQLAECPWPEVVVKPAVDGAARKAMRGRRDSDEVRRHVVQLTEWGDVLVQPYLTQIGEGERSLVFFDGRLSHAVNKTPAAGDYRSQWVNGGAEAPHEPDSAELQVALAAMAAAPGELTYARADLVLYEGVSTLMELEVIEPDLFFRDVPERLERYVAAVASRLSTPSQP